MSNQRVTDLTAASILNDTDYILVSQDLGGGTSFDSFKISVSNLRTLLCGKQYLWLDSGKDIFPSISNGASIATYESSTNKVNSEFLDFYPAAISYSQIRLSMPKQWDGGSIKAKIFWTSSASTGDVKWQLEGQSQADGASLDGAWGTAVATTDTATGANLVQVSPALSAINIGSSGDKISYLRISRQGADPSDTLSVVARLIGIQIQFDIGKVTPW